jgi:hypothetical protein
MKPLIIDNFLPVPVQELICKLFSGTEFHWSFSDYSVSPEELNEYFYTNEPVREHIQFRHGFVKDDIVTSDYYKYIEVLKLLFESHMKTKVTHINRIKSNLLISQKGPYIQPPHVDVMDMINGDTDCLGYKTLLYYVNDSDGDTILYNEYFTGEPVGLVTEQQRVSPKQGRAVIFDSNQIHSGSCPSINDTRMVINSVFAI